MVVLLAAGVLAAGCQGSVDVSTDSETQAQATPSPAAESDRAHLELLDAFAQAWNRHDADALMSMMTDDCVYAASAGDDVHGRRYEGQEAVRASFQAIFDAFPDAQWNDATHFVGGDRGLSEWRFTATAADGGRIETNGCDVFTFRDGRIRLKNSFRKNRPPVPAR